MDWEDVLEHLPQRLVVTDRKGRVLLLSGNVVGVNVGRSFLKLADDSEVVTVGRAAKRALRDGKPRKLAKVVGRDKKPLTITMQPFTKGSGEADHLLVIVADHAADSAEKPVKGPFRGTPAMAARREEPVPAPTPEPAAPVEPVAAQPEPAPPPQPVAAPPPPAPSPFKKPLRSPTPVPAERYDRAPMALGAKPTPAPVDNDTPPTQHRKVAPLPNTLAAAELVVVAAGGTMPLGRALESVMAGKIKARAWPVARFVDALGSRGAHGVPEIDDLLDGSTRLLFIGESPYEADIRAHPLRASEASNSGWAIAGKTVRRAAVWPGPRATDRQSELLADLQFEMMELVRKAMPMRRQGRITYVDPGMKLAAAFLEQPTAMDVAGDLRSQVRHHQLVLAIARFLQEGMELLLGKGR